MHLLFITDNYPPEVNAVASRVHERARYWVRWGHKVTVITSAPNFPQGKVYEGYKNKWCQLEEIDGVRVVRVKTFMTANKGFLLRVFDFISFMLSSFVASLFQSKPDVVIATSPQFFTAISGWAISKCRFKPFVFEVSDLWPESILAVNMMKKGLLIRLIEKIELFLYKQADSIVALTHSIKQNLVDRKVPQEKISVVINGVELSAYYPRKKNASLLEQYRLTNKFVFAYIGTHGAAHALENILHAAKLLSHTHPEFCFMFVGDGAEREKLIASKDRMELRNVLFIPAQSKNNIVDYWSLADVALIHLKNSSTFKTVLPSKIFEAMGMGLPLLFAGPKGEASDLIETTEIGLCAEAENPDELSQTCLQLFSNSELLKHFKENASNKASDHSREEQAHQFLNVIKKTVRKKKTKIIPKELEDKPS